MSTAYIDDILIFLQIVEVGRLSTVAQRQGTSVSAISKSLARLERFVGAPLLLRSPHSLSLTTAGQEFQANSILGIEHLNRGISAARGLDDGQQRRLRIFASLDVGQTLIAPIVFDYIRENSGIKVDFQMGYREVDILENKIDISISSVGARRKRGIGPSNVRQKLLGDISFKIVTSEKYLKLHGTPNSVAELETHHIINHTTDTWHFSVNSIPGMVKVDPVFKSNNWTTLQDATLAGLGIARLPDYIVRSAISRGHLIALFPNATLDHREVRAIFPNQRHLAATVRRFLDLIATRIPNVLKGPVTID